MIYHLLRLLYIMISLLQDDLWKEVEQVYYPHI